MKRLRQETGGAALDFFCRPPSAFRASPFAMPESWLQPVSRQKRQKTGAVQKLRGFSVRVRVGALRENARGTELLLATHLNPLWWFHGRGVGLAVADWRCIFWFLTE